MPKKTHRRSRFIRVIEALVVGAAVVAFWRGVWVLLDLYLIPKFPGISAVVSIVVAIGVLTHTHHLINSLSD